MKASTARIDVVHSDTALYDGHVKIIHSRKLATGPSSIC
jgi:hypothetical protein